MPPGMASPVIGVLGVAELSLTGLESVPAGRSASACLARICPEPPIRLDLYAPSERSYIPLRLPFRWRSSCPIPYSTSPPTPASPPTSSVTAIPSATSAPPCRAVWVPSRVFWSSSITRMMASREPSLCEERPGGCALVRDARAGRFSQIWVVRADRLGRDAFELLRIWRVFESIGVALRATDENIDDPFYFDIHAVIAANERRKFLERSAEGMNRAAKEGRYTGGIVPLGYSVSGDRGFRRLVPDDSPMWAGLSAADVVRRIYDHLAVDGWSCVRISLPSSTRWVYPRPIRRDGRGVRGKRTQGLWRSGRIRNLVVNPVYRGVLQYGRRSTKPNGREVISASVPPLVSEDVWDAAIATLKRNRALPRNSCHSYLLRSLIRCAVCGLSFCGTWTRGPRYRCNGSMAHRGPFAGKCIGASIKGEKLEAVGLVGCLPLPPRSPSPRR